MTRRPDSPAQPESPARPESAAPLESPAPLVAPQRPPARAYDDEVRTARHYERGLAVKGLIALVVVALVIAMRLLWF
jgi:hypothetical protein